MFVLGLVLTQIPLFNVLGYESSAAVAAAAFLVGGPLFVMRVRVGIFEAWSARVTRALIAVAFPAILLTLNTRVVPNCAPWTGAGFYLLIVCGGVAVAGAWGVAVASLTQRRWLRLVLWYALVVVSLLSTGLYLMFEPPVVAGNAVIGYFAGSIYDEALSIPTQLVVYRTWNLVFAAFLLVAMDILAHRRSGRRAGRARMAALLVLATVFLSMTLSGEDLGMWRTRDRIVADLGGLHETQHFIIHYDLASWHADEIDAIGHDHEFRHHQLAALFGPEPVPGGKVRSFIYRDREQKGDWLGIRNTLVAKLWLGETHIQYREFGDPILLHELAHLYSAPLGAGPLEVSLGRFGIPNIGVVEGYAEAVVGRRGELSLHAWSAAMRDRGLAPDVRQLVRPDGFYRASGGRAYTVVGSFAQFLLDRYGAQKWRAAYAWGDWEGVYGKDLEALVTEWEEFLDAQTLTNAELAQAEFAFARPSIFEKRCARYVAELRRQAASQAGQGAWPRAVDCYAEIMFHIPDDPTAALDLATGLMRTGASDRAGELIDRVLSREGVGRVATSRAFGLRGDLAARQGNDAAAKGAWEAALALHPRTSTQRLLAAKIAGIEHTRGREYFFGDLRPSRSMYEISAWVAERPRDTLGRYLLGRRLWAAHDCAAALPHLERAAPLPTPALGWEARRIEGICQLRAGDLDGATTTFRTLTADERLPSGLRVAANEWLTRIRWQREEAPKLTRPGPKDSQ